MEEIKINKENVDKVKDLIKKYDNLMLKYGHNDNDSFQAQILKDGRYYEVIMQKNGRSKTNTQMDLDDLSQWISWRFQDSFYDPEIEVHLFTFHQSLKGTKTAVWGKKSHRDDLASALSNNFKKML